MDKKEDLLYHYTTVEGFHGIVTSRKLWASNCCFTNDINELNKALECLISYFDQSERYALYKIFYNYILFNHVCIASFSKSPCVLSQWRAYADDGKGLVIGFSPLGFDDLTIYFVECSYEDCKSSIESLLKDELQNINELLYHHKKDLSQNLLENIEKNPKLLQRLILKLLAIKNSAFKEE